MAQISEITFVHF